MQLVNCTLKRIEYILPDLVPDKYQGSKYNVQRKSVSYLLHTELLCPIHTELYLWLILDSIYDHILNSIFGTYRTPFHS